MPYLPSHVSFDPTKGTLLIGVPKEALALQAISPRALSEGFEFKKEFHITIIGYAAGQRIRARAAAGGRVLEDAVQNLVRTTNWEFSLEPALYRIRKEYSRPSGIEVREAYIQKAAVAQLQAFYEKLSAITGLAMEAPPAHVTLCVKGSGSGWRDGIGIATAEELKRYMVEEITIV